MPDKDITIDEVKYITKLSKLEIPESPKVVQSYSENYPGPSLPWATMLVFWRKASLDPASAEAKSFIFVRTRP